MATERKQLLGSAEIYIVALSIVGIVDAVSYMLVTPSLIFYVKQNGGTQQQYGFIMSAFSFARFCCKPLVGWWSDQRGFRVPYLSSVSVAILGGGAYCLASALPKGSLSVGCVLGARLISGCGAAKAALGYAYVAKVVPPSQQTAVNSVLSLCQMVGMAIGPAMNVLVAKVDLPITFNWRLDSLNSVGLMLVLTNSISMVVIYCLLDEPSLPDDVDDDVPNEASALVAVTPVTPDIYTTRSTTPMRELVGSFCSLDILIPILSFFSFNANFQAIETGFAPASHDALGWRPVQSSVTLGSLSIIIAANMICVIKLTKKGVSNAHLLFGGTLTSVVACGSIYRFWIKDSSMWNFYLPVALFATSFPYMMPTTRTIFTASINSKLALREHQGICQAVLSMAASLAGFLTPWIVTTYFLRTPEEVSASADKRELKPWFLLSPFLLSPFLSLLVLLGIGYLMVIGSIAATTQVASVDDETRDDEGLAAEKCNESSSLLPEEEATGLGAFST